MNTTLKTHLIRQRSLLALLVLVIIVAVLNPKFITPDNLFNIFRQTSVNAVIAVGMTLVILTAGIDLSVGSVVALTGAVAAVVVIGNGNVALDLARMLSKDEAELAGSDLDPDHAAVLSAVREVTVVGRGAPEAARFDVAMIKEFGRLAGTRISVPPDTTKSLLPMVTTSPSVTTRTTAMVPWVQVRSRHDGPTAHAVVP